MFTVNSMAIKFVERRDVDYETAKKEVAGYFQMKGEAYASDASTDLQLDYELVGKILDELEKEGKMEPVGRRVTRSATRFTVTGS